MQTIFDLIIDCLPAIITGVSGLIVGFIFYLSKRIKYKTLVIEKDIENAKLQEAIVNSSFVICPNCSEKIYLKDATVHTGGIINENAK